MLVRPGADVEQSCAILANASLQVMDHYHASSVHMTFLPEDEANSLSDMGFLLRTDQHFHWFNQNYQSFEEFLEQLSARKRKTVRRERRGAAGENGITVEWLSGSDLMEHHWDAFFFVLS